jgi:glutathione S-transferase
VRKITSLHKQSKTIQQQLIHTMSKTIQLYWGSGSPFARRVQILLFEKKIPFESKLLEFSKKEHKTEEFLRINPRGKVPALVDNDVTVHESVAILQYLEKKFGPISETTGQTFANTLARTLEVDGYFHTGLLNGLLQAWFKKEDEWNVTELKESLEKLSVELKNWDSFVANGTYVNGSDDFSVADAAFAPTLAMLNRFGYDFKENGLDNLDTYWNTISQRQSIVDSIPPHWKDTTNNKYTVVKQKISQL